MELFNFWAMIYFACASTMIAAKFEFIKEAKVGEVRILATLIAFQSVFVATAVQEIVTWKF